MKANIISLKKDVIRRDAIVSRLSDLTYDYTVYDAIDYEASSGAISRLGIELVSKEMTPGEVGCALSHLDIMVHATDSGVFILEDDVVPLIENPFRNNSEVDLIDGEVLFLGVSIKKEWLAYDASVTRLGMTCLRLDGLSIPMIRGACAYVMNKNTAMRIAQSQRKQLKVADAWKVFYRQGVVNRFLYAEVFVHPEVSLEQSNIETERSHRLARQSLARRFMKACVWSGFSLVRRITGSKMVVTNER